MARRRSIWPFALIFSIAVCLYLYSSTDARLIPTRLNQLGIAVETRVLWWDWKDTPEEEFCWQAHDLAAEQSSIPNVVHFVLLAHEGQETNLTYARFLAIKAAILRVGDAQVKLHTYALNESNHWWKLLEKHVTLVKHSRDELEGPHGLPMEDLQLAHQADIFRLNILLKEGGIYLDTDMYALRSFKNLMSSPRDILMGHEGGNRYGLCNAVIIARPGSEFVKKWLDTYATFDVQGWNEHSVRKPKQLQVLYPDLICPLSPTVFFWPTWATAHVKWMYDPISQDDVASLKENMSAHGGAMYANQLAIHAWGAHDQTSGITEENIQTDDTRFNILLREIAKVEL